MLYKITALLFIALPLFASEKDKEKTTWTTEVSVTTEVDGTITRHYRTWQATRPHIKLHSKITYGQDDMPIKLTEGLSPKDSVLLQDARMYLICVQKFHIASLTANWMKENTNKERAEGAPDLARSYLHSTISIITPTV